VALRQLSISRVLLQARQQFRVVLALGTQLARQSGLLLKPQMNGALGAQDPSLMRQRALMPKAKRSAKEREQKQSEQSWPPTTHRRTNSARQPSAGAASGTMVWRLQSACQTLGALASRRSCLLTHASTHASL
jgi:hypothetical protein